MSQLTVVLIGERALGVVSARSAPGGVEILRAANAALPESFAAMPPEERAAVVRKALAACGGGDSRVALVVPRSMAILREFDVPGGSPEELQQMVRFQLEKELPLPIDQLRYSYVESSGTDGKIHVHAAAVPTEQIDSLARTLQAAGCRVQAAYVSSFGLASLLPKDAPLEGGSALVGLTDGTAEILIVDGQGSPALSRSVPMREFSTEGLATEVSRTILSWSGRGAGREVKRVLIAGEGEDADRVTAELKKLLSESVDRLVLNGSITRRPDVTVGLDTAAAAGVCVGALRGRPPMPDLLRPPGVRRKFRLKQSHRVAILATLVTVALFAWSQVALSDRRVELDRLKADLKKIEPEALQVNQTRDRVKLAGQWMDERYAWIDAFNALQDKVDRSKIWLTSLVVDDTGSLRLQGKATGDDQVSKFIVQLQKVAAFKKVEGEYTKPNQDKTGYKFDFAIKIQLAGLASVKRK